MSELKNDDQGHACDFKKENPHLLQNVEEYYVESLYIYIFNPNLEILSASIEQVLALIFNNLVRSKRCSWRDLFDTGISLLITDKIDANIAIAFFE